MSKIRVHELAKEFSIPPKEMEAWIKSHGYPIKNYSSTLEDHEVREIRIKFREEQVAGPLNKGDGGGQSQKTSEVSAESATSKTPTVVRRRPSIKLTKITSEPQPSSDASKETMAVVSEKSGGAAKQVEAIKDKGVSPSMPVQPQAASSEPATKTAVEGPKKPQKTTEAQVAKPVTPESYVKIIKKETPAAISREPQTSAPEDREHKTVQSKSTTDRDVSQSAPIQPQSEPETITEPSVEGPEKPQKAIEIEKTDATSRSLTQSKIPEHEGSQSTAEQTPLPETGTKDEKKHPLREVMMGKREKGHERHETSQQKDAQQPKSYVKIVDRPRIVLPQPQPPQPRQPQRPSRPTIGAPSGATNKGRKNETIPSNTVQARSLPHLDITTPVLDVDKRTKKKEMPKRVVQVSEMEEAAKRRKAATKKIEKLKPITKLLSEELDSDMMDALLPETSMDETLPEPVFRTAVGKIGPGKKKASRDARDTNRSQSSQPFHEAQMGRKKLIMDEAIQLGDLAKKMGVKSGDLIAKLMGMGVMATINQSIDFDTAALLASEFNFEVEKRTVAEDILLEFESKGSGELVLRPPVVTVMGHVDHGKTSLLDAIREADVVSKEAGGITQHIGAYHVTLASGHDVVFLDTPGHEAFTAMRARGAQITDIVVLVVAADDGVMAQTKEAIDHAKAANVPIIVAINKIDKPNANIERVKRELAEYGLVPEEWGGDTIFVNISAKKRIGIEEFLEMLALQSEVMELKADPTRFAKGHVVESKLDKGRGPVATLLISDGTLHVGDSMVCGMHYGKIRAMNNDKGLPIKSAGPSMPVEVLGLSGVPSAGDEFVVLPDEKKAREVAEYRQRKHREIELAKSIQKISLDNVFDRIKAQDMKELGIILKTDVQGSLEAISDALKKLSTPDVTLQIVASGIGAISESDVLLASASNAIIIGFNVKPNPQARALAEQEKVDIRFYDVIFNLLDEVKNAMAGLLEPVFKEKNLGRAVVKQVFMVPKVGAVAGCAVTEGVVQRNAKARLLRDNVVVYTGKIISLRRFKEDVKEVGSGYECGIGLERFNDIKEGDIIEAFVLEETKPILTG